MADGEQTPKHEHHLHMPHRDPERPRRRGGERLPAFLFSLAIVAVIGFVAAYIVTYDASSPRPGNQIMGTLAALGLMGIGAGMVVWAKRFMTPKQPEVEDRGRLASTPEEIAAFTSDFEVGEFEMERRGLLTKLLGAAIGAAGLAALVPLRSLGPAPGDNFTKSGWSNGKYVVDEQGRRVRANRINTDSILTVFPEGIEEKGKDLSQTVLIGLQANKFQVPPGRENWIPNNIGAFSKVCVHAGCPVGLYQAESALLICPCHQSTFNVNNACDPIFGPATNPLPQLPLAIDKDGHLFATGDFSAPPGPGFWNQRKTS